MSSNKPVETNFILAQLGFLTEVVQDMTKDLHAAEKDIKELADTIEREINGLDELRKEINISKEARS